jgi:hypothetical protein
MLIKVLTVVCSLVVASVVSPLAQSRAKSADPVTGTWSGVFRVSDREIPIALNLKHDGKGTVSGTLSGMPHPGEVKKGGFDIKTSVLTLHLGKTDEDAVLIALEGKVAGDAVTGTIETENGPGTFLVKKGG